MNIVEQERLRQVLDDRSGSIADRWYRAIRRTAFTPVRPPEVRKQIAALTEQVLQVLLSEPFDPQRAQEVGMGVALLHYLQPEAIGATLEVLSQELTGQLSLELHAVLHARVAAVLGAVAAGYFAQSRAIMLEEQEEIRLALVTTRRQVEEEQRARAVAEAELRARNEVLSAVAHDLRAPLATIKGRAQLLARQAQVTEVHRDNMVRQVASIDTAVTRMARMIDDLRDVVTLQAGQTLPLERQLTDLVALAQRVAAESPHAVDHRVEVEHTVPDIIGWWDIDRLARVLDNLLTNAGKYSPEGSRVTVMLSCDERMAQVEVRDNGQGIPAADLSRIFDWFHRGRNVGNASGAGIGLAVSRRIVEQHQGTIIIESEVGVGTAVIVRLPREP